MTWWKWYGFFGTLCHLAAASAIILGVEGPRANAVAAVLISVALATRQCEESVSPWRRLRDATIAWVRGRVGPRFPWIYSVGLGMVVCAQMLPGAHSYLRAALILVGLTLGRRGFDQPLPSLLERLRITGHSQIVRPPGSTCRSVIDFFYSPKTVARVFDPILADMQAEWVEAIARGRHYKASWIRLRGYWEIARAAGFHSLLRALRPIMTLFTSSA